MWKFPNEFLPSIFRLVLWVLDTCHETGVSVVDYELKTIENRCILHNHYLSGIILFTWNCNTHIFTLIEIRYSDKIGFRNTELWSVCKVGKTDRWGWIENPFCDACQTSWVKEAETRCTYIFLVQLPAKLLLRINYIYLRLINIVFNWYWGGTVIISLWGENTSGDHEEESTRKNHSQYEETSDSNPNTSH